LAVGIVPAGRPRILVPCKILHYVEWYTVGQRKRDSCVPKDVRMDMTVNSGMPGQEYHSLPSGLRRDDGNADRAAFANCSEDATGVDTGCFGPRLHRCPRLRRKWNTQHLAPFAPHNGDSMTGFLLQIIDSETQYLGNPPSLNY
jgi:hypothetical protein